MLAAWKSLSETFRRVVGPSAPANLDFGDSEAGSVYFSICASIWVDTHKKPNSTFDFLLLLA